ncbi:MAG: LCP family protein [Oscillospiraceae bacterium]|nr:LCP family protein [Oscillospiraceae bacterium]
MKLFGGTGRRERDNRYAPEIKRRNEDELILTPPEVMSPAPEKEEEPEPGPESGFDYSAAVEAAAEEIFWHDAGDDETVDLREVIDEFQSEKPEGAWKFPAMLRGLSPARKIIIACLAAVIVISGAVAAYNIWSSPPEVSTGGPTTPDVPRTSSNGTTTGPGSSGNASDDDDDPSDLRRKGCYTFLIVGIDAVGNNTDTIIIGMMDTVSRAVDFISIPRDTLVNVSWGTKRVNTIYPAAVNNGKDPIKSIKDGIRDLIGFEPDSYALIDLTAFEKLIDAIGGVTYNVPIDMYYEAPDQDLHIAIPKGEHLLDGEESLKVVRFRSGYQNGDIGRIDTQHDFMMTAAKQLLTFGNIPNLPKFIEIYQQYVITDLTASNLAFYAEEFLKTDRENIRFHTLPGEYNGSIKGGSYVFADLEEWLKMINEYINPWKVEITEANLNMLTRQNGSFYSTTGVIAGGEDSFVDYAAYIASLEEENQIGGADGPADTN